MRVHVFETGRLSGNERFMRAESWASLLLPRRPYEFPVLSWVIEQPDGLTAIDTGLGSGPEIPGIQRRMVPFALSRSDMSLADQMRAAGLDPAEVRTVLLTHLDWDHAGGMAHFPNAEIRVHRPDLELAGTRPGRLRFRCDLWPDGVAPVPYDLEPEPFGAFPESLRTGSDGNIVIVPLAGHSPGQTGVFLDHGDRPLFFTADHFLRQDWFEDDWNAGRLLGLGIFQRAAARETSRRVHDLVSARRPVLLPSHDSESQPRLEAANPAAAVAG